MDSELVGELKELKELGKPEDDPYFEDESSKRLMRDVFTGRSHRGCERSGRMENS